MPAKIFSKKIKFAVDFTGGRSYNQDRWKEDPKEDKDMTEEMYRLIQEIFELTDEQLECVKEVYEG